MQHRWMKLQNFGGLVAVNILEMLLFMVGYVKYIYIVLTALF